jgi:two-component system OmpR family sensor kinase
VADAAHEMRSPLTALSLQTERLAAADMPAEARRRMQDLAQGLTRTRALLDQLLALARSQQSAQNAPSAVSLQRVLRDVIEDLYPLAEERAIDLGVLSADDAMIHAQPLDLHLLVKNLIDNAIRYTPRHGRVDVSLAARDGGVDFIVDDTGPGIAEAERERVFGAFYRGAGDIGVPGSGLGLAIVKAVADKMGATVTLAAPPATGAGLRVVVGFVTGR